MPRPRIDPARKAVKLTVTLSADMAEALAKHENQSEVIRQALAAWLKKEGRKG